MRPTSKANRQTRLAQRIIEYLSQKNEPRPGSEILKAINRPSEDKIAAVRDTSYEVPGEPALKTSQLRDRDVLNLSREEFDEVVGICHLLFQQNGSDAELRKQPERATSSAEPKFFENKIGEGPIEEVPVWLTTEQAATFLGISKKSLLNIASNGKIPFSKFGRRNRYLRSDLHELLLANRRGGFHGN